ncbi:hypothetical protein ZOSMA_5G02370 [Zostera marina]|uniref:Uncharacterized protein n=1 Tax=Zostera marina TaxID=29655 RepID=A0A0K9NWJ7_ZOSMR|nr:hypothetical protein ZOSMA_5G02370 [Zostera marina]
MEGKMKSWDFYNEMPLNDQYFQKEVDLFKVPQSPMVCLYHKESEQKKHRTTKAVDEDLYKIPPEFLYQKPKKRMVVSDFWKRCLGLSCIP